jgi:hypothetical protein
VVFSLSIRRSKSKNENKPYVKSKSQSLTFTLEKKIDLLPPLASCDIWAGWLVLKCPGSGHMCWPEALNQIRISDLAYSAQMGPFFLLRWGSFSAQMDM